MLNRWCLVGAPSSAGAHTPGVEQAPAALREAGLLDALRRRGVEVDDHGDVPGFRWRPDVKRPRAQNAGAVARVAEAVAEAVGVAVDHGGTPLVMGGDCTVTIGLVAGYARTGTPPALVYVDGGPDLYTPETRAHGNLDAMGLAHMLALPGHVPEVAGVGPSVPLLTPERVVVYGDALPPGDHERDLVEGFGMTYVPADEVHSGVAPAARRARAAAEDAAAAFLVHFDVDVLTFVTAPLADVPEPAGLTLDEAAETLSVLVASPSFAGMTITEINPDHLPDLELLRDFCEKLAAALT
jgi:arginase